MLQETFVHPVWGEKILSATSSPFSADPHVRLLPQHGHHHPAEAAAAATVHATPEGVPFLNVHSSGSCFQTTFRAEAIRKVDLNQTTKGEGKKNSSKKWSVLLLLPRC